MALLGEISLVVLATALAVFGVGAWVSRQLVRAGGDREPRSAGAHEIREHLLRMLLRMFVVLGIVGFLAWQGGERRLPLIFAASATYFAAILGDAVWKARPMEANPS